jgi:hypothetical protein
LNILVIEKTKEKEAEEEENSGKPLQGKRRNGKHMDGLFRGVIDPTELLKKTG